MKRTMMVSLLYLVWSGSPYLTALQQTSTDQKRVVAPQQSAPANPETVLATFRVKSEQLAAFLEMMPEYWKALRDLSLVDAEPHLLLQGEENGKPIVIQVFTWKSEDIPDHAPPEIRKYWDRMNTMVETRNGQPGIDFPPMKVVDIEHQSHASSK